jgi:hypothetical protein
LRKHRCLLRCLLLLLQTREPKLRTLQTHNAAHLCASETNVRSELRACLLSTERLLERCLRPLRRTFKTLCAHLRCGARLLLHNVALQLLLGNRLTRSTKSACANRLCSQPCACDIALAADVGECLLHGSVFELAHEGANVSRVKEITRSRQSANPSNGDALCLLPSSSQCLLGGAHLTGNLSAQGPSVKLRGANT